jgi:hypothetical protein
VVIAMVMLMVVAVVQFVVVMKMVVRGKLDIMVLEKERYGLSMETIC